MKSEAVIAGVKNRYDIFEIKYAYIINNNGFFLYLLNNPKVIPIKNIKVKLPKCPKSFMNDLKPVYMLVLPLFEKRNEF